MIKMNPRYIVDYGKGKFHIFDREALNFLDEKNYDDFRGLKWMKEIGSLAGEAAHLSRHSNKSNSSPWKSKDSIKEFYKLCEKMGVELRLLPEQSIFKYRQEFAPGEKKTDPLDLKVWHEAIKKNPSIWDVALRPKNVEWHDPKELYDDIKRGNIRPENMTPYQAGCGYKNALKTASNSISANGGDYKKTIPGKIAYDQNVLREVARRLQNHNSNDGQIKNGISKIIINGETIEISLLDVLEFEPGKNNTWKCHRECQYVTCMMLLVDDTGKRYVNPKTNKPVGFKMIKQFGFVSSAFHNKSGSLRAKFYHWGIKPFSKKYFKKIFKFVKGDKIDYRNDEHEVLKKFITKTCRIAYEQTTKAMKKYLDEQTTEDMKKYLDNPSNTLEEHMK